MVTTQHLNPIPLVPDDSFFASLSLSLSPRERERETEEREVKKPTASRGGYRAYKDDYEDQPVRDVLTPEGYRAREVLCRKCKVWRWIGYFPWRAPGRVDKDCVCDLCAPSYRRARKWRSDATRKALALWAKENRHRRTTGLGGPLK